MAGNLLVVMEAPSGLSLYVVDAKTMEVIFLAGKNSQKIQTVTHSTEGSNRLKYHGASSFDHDLYVTGYGAQGGWVDKFSVNRKIDTTTKTILTLVESRPIVQAWGPQVESSTTM